MEVEVDIKGEVVESCKHTDEKLVITFEGGTTLEVTFDSYNASCHCHPEYEYYLDVELEKLEE